MRNVDLFDDYLNGNMSPDEVNSFELRLKEDDTFASDYKDYLQLVETIQETILKDKLKAKLKRIHRENFGKNNIVSLNQRTGKTFFNTYIRPFSVAASVAILAVISTLFLLSAGGFLIKKQNTDYTELRKELSQLKSNQDAIRKDLSNQNKKKVQPANYSGTGFAINNKGYLVTSLHMVNGSDSVFVGLKTGENIPTRIVYTDNRLDIAILKMEDNSFFNGVELPYAFKSNESELGERIFTLGYPTDVIVYGEGSLSSAAGSGDTAQYQISIPVNPGNSGGPLFDEQGNIIGIIRGKNVNAEGTGYAIKSIYVKQLIDSIENDELRKELKISGKNNIKRLKRNHQIKSIEPFVFNVLVYKSN